MKDAMNHWMHSNRSAWRAIVVGARALQACARRAWDFYRERRCTRLIYETLLELDDRTLRDLGFDRSEVMSVAAEVAALADRTRLNARPASAACVQVGQGAMNGAGHCPP